MTPHDSEQRFVIGREIGRGGLGRIVEAVERDLDRTVALKLVREDLPPELAERFAREARLTARLEHPNIVPIHEFAVVDGDDGAKKLMLAMKRVHGRDLRQLLTEVAKGGPERERWSRARLLRVFQDICLGVAFAHSKKVIHRDLKPANVMIGDYGETLIVDWGLAKESGPGRISVDERRGTEAAQPVGEATRIGLAGVTMEGDLVGTPAYMSPEQAAGRLADIDERSDIYSLGAILYEILTWQTPVDGNSLDEILSRTQFGDIAPPSSRIRSGSRVPGGNELKFEGVPHGPDIIPTDLDAIVMKALALRREDRFQSARELHDEIQLFLEGVKEREREHRLAEDEVAKAKEAVARQARLEKEAAAADRATAAMEKTVKPLADKSELWALDDRATELERLAVDATAEADRALTVALGHEKGHREARRMKAELYWAKFLEAEKAGERSAMQLHRATVEQFNDGPFNALLKGDGTLAVTARAWPCRCLVEGRQVPPRELVHLGHHPFSGRRLDLGATGQGLRELGPSGPVTLKVHGGNCVKEDVAGADVWLWRYEESGRLLMPVTPEGAATGPPAPIDRLFGADSPFRPQGPGSYLGRTPVAPRPLPMGSWLIALSRDGFEPVRCPVSIQRCERSEILVTLYGPHDIPDDMVPVTPGTFGWQGDRQNRYTLPAELKHLDEYFIARHPVTCREYAEFLNGVGPEEAARRVPRESPLSGYYWPGPPYAVPTEAWMARAPAEMKSRVRRLRNSPADWEEEWPVFGVSWEDAMAYCAWQRTRSGGLVALPDEEEWEKAARGTDRRAFPFGPHYDDRWCNGMMSTPNGPRPVSVHLFPHDESPYGVRGLAGNSRDHCVNDPGPDYPGWRAARGGNWGNVLWNSLCSYRAGNSATELYHHNGFRIARIVTLAPGLA